MRSQVELVKSAATSGNLAVLLHRRALGLVAIDRHRNVAHQARPSDGVRQFSLRVLAVEHRGEDVEVGAEAVLPMLHLGAHFAEHCLFWRRDFAGCVCHRMLSFLVLVIFLRTRMP